MFAIGISGIGYWWLLPAGLLVLAFFLCVFACRRKILRGEFSCCSPSCCGRQGTRGLEGDGPPEPRPGPPRD